MNSNTGELHYLHLLNRRIWIAIAILILILPLWLHIAGLELAIHFPAGPVGLLGIFLILGLFSRYIKPNDMLFFYSNCYAQVTIFFFVINMLTYLGTTLHFPLRDAFYIRVDEALGLDWLAYMEWWNSQKFWVAVVLTAGYYSLMPQLLFIVSIIFISNRIAQGQRFVLAVIFSNMIGVVLSTLFPAVAEFIHLDIDPLRYKTLVPHMGRVHEETFMMLYNRTSNVIDFPGAGIVTFPSFHALLAVLYMYASLAVPLLAIIAIPLNIILIVATPVYGGHYFIDVFAGIAIALAGIAFAERVLPTRRYPNKPTALAP